MKLVAFLVLAIALSLAGIAMDGLIERHECAAVSAANLNNTPPCDGYKPQSRSTESAEWVGALLLLTLSGFLFSTRTRNQRGNSRLLQDRRSSSTPDHVST